LNYQDFPVLPAAIRLSQEVFPGGFSSAAQILDKMSAKWQQLDLGEQPVKARCTDETSYDPATFPSSGLNCPKMSAQA
jgi:hypothetical protein